VQKSSGIAAFDNSAVAAVYKSSPLPVPKDPQAFGVFRSFKLTLKPENIKGAPL
jgi:colicin import membrane protein